MAAGAGVANEGRLCGGVSLGTMLGAVGVAVATAFLMPYLASTSALLPVTVAGAATAAEAAGTSAGAAGVTGASTGAAAAAAAFLARSAARAARGSTLLMVGLSCWGFACTGVGTGVAFRMNEGISMFDSAPRAAHLSLKWHPPNLLQLDGSPVTASGVRALAETFISSTVSAIFLRSKARWSRVRVTFVAFARGAPLVR